MVWKPHQCKWPELMQAHLWAPSARHKPLNIPVPGSQVCSKSKHIYRKPCRGTSIYIRTTSHQNPQDFKAVTALSFGCLYICDESASGFSCFLPIFSNICQTLGGFPSFCGISARYFLFTRATWLGMLLWGWLIQGALLQQGRWWWRWYLVLFVFWVSSDIFWHSVASVRGFGQM